MNDDTLADHLEQLHHQHRPITTAEVARDLNSLEHEFRTYRRQTGRILTFLGALAGTEGIFLIAWAIAR